jgi:hypothetical protein
MSVIPVMQGNTDGRIAVQARPSINRDPISKITSAKRAAGVAQVVASLPNKHKVLSSTPSTALIYINFLFQS